MVITRWPNPSASKTKTKTDPRAMAPTKTAIEWVSGRVGRNFDSRTVGTSPDRVSLIVLVGKWSVTGFYESTIESE